MDCLDFFERDGGVWEAGLLLDSKAKNFCLTADDSLSYSQFVRVEESPIWLSKNFVDWRFAGIFGARGSHTHFKLIWAKLGPCPADEERKLRRRNQGLVQRRFWLSSCSVNEI